jgi:hypothetical protein
MPRQPALLRVYPISNWSYWKVWYVKLQAPPDYGNFLNVSRKEGPAVLLHREED